MIDNIRVRSTLRRIPSQSILVVLIIMLAAPQALAAQSGTGFVVSRQGHVLTNNHVIAGTRSLRGQIEGRDVGLSIVAADKDLDLAILKIDGAVPPPLAFRKGKPVRPGDMVVSVGYPLQGILAREVNVTTGDVSASAGPGGDKSLMQITAPIQPGNSGGPVLDASGLVVGVAVAKLGAKETFEITGDIPQNVNFAIKGGIAQDFLERNGIVITLRDPGADLKPADIGETARKSTVFILGDSSGSAKAQGRQRGGDDMPGAGPSRGGESRRGGGGASPELPPVLSTSIGQDKFNYALEYLRDNTPLTWQDPDTGAQVTAVITATDDQPGRAPCRDFEVRWEKTYFDGRACRRAKMDWRVQ